MSLDRELAPALELLRRKLSTASRAAVPAPPASQLLQRHGLETTIEGKICGEMLASTSSRGGRPGAEVPIPPFRSLLVVDVARTGRAAALWVGQVMEFLARTNGPPPQITLALPGTRWAGRGKLLRLHLRDVARRTGIAAELVCGPASVERSAALEPEERAVIENCFDLIVVLGLAGAAGLDAPWPLHPARGWLELAQGAVLSFIDADSVMDELSRYANVAPPRPLRLRVEQLDDDVPDVIGELDLGDLEAARRSLPPLVEQARDHPWRVVVRPPVGRSGGELGCYDARAASHLLEPLATRRTLVAGRVLLAAT